MADRHDTHTKVVALIAEQLQIPAGTMNDSATLDSLGADSLDRVELVMKLEELFNIEIDDAAADKFKTVEDVVVYIHNLRK